MTAAEWFYEEADHPAVVDPERTVGLTDRARLLVPIDRAVRKYRQRVELDEWPTFELPASLRRAA